MLLDLTVNYVSRYVPTMFYTNDMTIKRPMVLLLRSCSEKMVLKRKNPKSSGREEEERFPHHVFLRFSLNT